MNYNPCFSLPIIKTSFSAEQLTFSIAIHLEGYHESLGDKFPLRFFLIATINTNLTNECFMNRIFNSIVSINCTQVNYGIYRLVIIVDRIINTTTNIVQASSIMVSPILLTEDLTITDSSLYIFPIIVIFTLIVVILFLIVTKKSKRKLIDKLISVKHKKKLKKYLSKNLKPSLGKTSKEHLIRLAHTRAAKTGPITNPMPPTQRIPIRTISNKVRAPLSPKLSFHIN